MLGIYHEALKKSPGVVYGVKKEHGEDNEKEDQDTPFRQQRRIY